MDEVLAQPTGVEDTLAALNAKIDVLAEQVAFLAEEARVERRRRQEWDELKQDMTPIVNDVYLLSVEQLAEIDHYVQLEDILVFFKRLLRNTRNLEQLLDQLESLQDFTKDASPLAQDAFLQLVQVLDEMERKGYFSFVREAVRIADIIVSSFTPEDVRMLGDNIVLILNTVKEMTQPEMMRLLHSLTSAYRGAQEHPETLPTSTLALLKQMRDPQVKQGLALTMQMLRIVAENRAQSAQEDGNGRAQAVQSAS